MRDVNKMTHTYDQYYSEHYSFRNDWFGPITNKYIIPKYFQLLDKFINKKNKRISLLEIGAGDGEVTDMIRSNRPMWKIVPTEYVYKGVQTLKEKGYKNAKQVDAVNLPFRSNSFDYVVCFDVMHHVSGPAKMASEMTRVAKKGVFLIEANRASVFRRILERTDIYRRAGEFSYYPIEYKAFFNIPDVRSIDIKPFQFIPPKLSRLSLNLVIGISEFLSILPLLRWQCSGLAIEVRKRLV